MKSTGLYRPVDVEDLGGGQFDIAFLWPLLPVPVTLTAGKPLPNTKPFHLNDALLRSNKDEQYRGFGGQYGGKAAGWSFVAGGNLPAGTLNVTAYDVTAGPTWVGIAGEVNTADKQATLGFAVQVPQGQAPAGAVHWVQVIDDNYRISRGRDSENGYGKEENIVDIGRSNATPYYDQGQSQGATPTANALNFFDAPQRDNAANPDQPDWWLAELFLASGPANNQPGQVTLYNTGVEWGWANFHIDVGPVANAFQALRQQFAFDTSSLSNFDLALDCDPARGCPLNAFVTTSSLAELDADFNAAIPEPNTWALTLLGFGGLGLLGWRRPRGTAATVAAMRTPTRPT